MANGYIPAQVERGGRCEPVKIENRAFLGGVLGIDVNGELQPISDGIVDLTFIEDDLDQATAAAAQSAAEAQAAQLEAETANTAAQGAKADAQAAASDAQAAQTAAEAAKTAAQVARAGAETAQTGAQAAQTAAQAAQTGAQSAQTAAESAATAAAGSSSDASASATAASGSASQAAASATNAASSATAASGSATQAAGSATAANTSAQAAATLVEVATQAAADAETAQTAAEAAQAGAEAAEAQATAIVPGVVTSWLNEHVDPATGYVIDDTLTIQGAAADAKKTGDELTNLNSIIELGKLPQPIVFTDNKRFKTTSGTITEENNSGYRCAKIACSEGDTFTISITSPATSSIYYGYVFVDSNNTLVPGAPFGRGDINNDIVTAPAGASYICINDQKSGKTSYKNAPLDLQFVRIQQGASAKFKIPAFDINGDFVASGGNHITKTADEITITLGKAQFLIIKRNQAQFNIDTWHTNECVFLYKEAGYWVSIWSSSDSDGTVKISGESDFIGGYHGNEKMTDFKLYVDGVLFADESIISDAPFDEIKLCIKSNVYHYNSSYTGLLAFERNKILTFNSDGYKIENYWKAKGTFSVALAYFGMLSVNKYTNARYDSVLLNGYYVNDDFSVMDAGTGYESLSGSKTMTEANFFTKYGDISISNKDYFPADKYRGRVDVYTDRRLKAYCGLSDVALNENDVIKGTAIIRIPN